MRSERDVMTGQGAKRKTRGDSRDVVFIASRGSKARESIYHSRTRGTRVVNQKGGSLSSGQSIQKGTAKIVVLTISLIQICR